MAHPKQIDAADVLQSALQALETKGRSSVSLRGIAAQLGVKAPSLYRYFPDKAALEQAMIQQGMQLLTVSLQKSRSGAAEMQFRKLCKAYLSFARQRPALYSCIMEHVSGSAYSSPSGKALWGLLLDVIAPISGDPDDTSSAVATWAFLHGFAVLERSGPFGKSGPRQGLETGLSALLLRFHQMRKASSLAG